MSQQVGKVDRAAVWGSGAFEIWCAASLPCVNERQRDAILTVVRRREVDEGRHSRGATQGAEDRRVDFTA